MMLPKDAPLHVTAPATEYKVARPALYLYGFLLSYQIIPTSPSSGTMVSFHHQFNTRGSPATVPENCSPPSHSCGLGHDIVNNISRIAHLFGSVTTFRAYLEFSAQSSKSVVLRSELQSSGVTMIDCPHNGKKDVVDKMILGVFPTCHSFPRC